MNPDYPVRFNVAGSVSNSSKVTRDRSAPFPETRFWTASVLRKTSPVSNECNGDFSPTTRLTASRFKTPRFGFRPYPSGSHREIQLAFVTGQRTTLALVDEVGV